MTTRILITALLALIVGCDSVASPQAVNPNLVDDALLRPALLDDRREMEGYLAALPSGVYKIYQVGTHGKFYLDEPKDVIKDGLRRGQVWEPDLERLFPKHVKPGTTVIDAGAHIGTHTLSLARAAGPEGRVYAFEPQKKIYRELVFNLRLNGTSNVVPMRFALGRSAGVIEMSPTLAGNEGGTAVGKGGDKAELRPLDSFGFRNLSFIKIDVEGFEDEVLEGARLTIARNRPVILIEIQGGHSLETAPPEIRAKIDGTRARLTGMGYKVEHLKGADYLAIPR